MGARRAKPRRYRGGSISLTAFEAAWLVLHLDTTPDEAIDTLEGVDLPQPRRVKADPHAAWDRIVAKVATVAPSGPLDTTVEPRAALKEQSR